ncbi:protein IWS1 homolog isoform X2 [Drosophila kikkawai]|uniref:Protein IWS1 homolog isoform X2 n=1 Tax=Drosophila kikkawai TaxID=30033 RepID=A0ABM4GG41_DROKI
MDLDWWQPSIIVGLICLLLPSQISPASAWSLPVRDSAVSAPVGRRLNEVSPYVDLALCPIRAEPWTCARQQSARILDAWDGELHVQWQKLKVEADRQMNATIERRGYSTSELPVKEKPSTILKKIEIGTNYMKKYLAESMDGFLGREYEYLQTPKAAEDDSENDDGDDDDETDAADDNDTSNAAEEEEDAAKDEDEDDDDEDENEDISDSTAEQDDQDTDPENDDEDVDEAASEPEKEAEKETVPSIFSGQPATTAAAAQDDGKSPAFSEGNSSSGVEFIELQDGDETAAGALKKPGGGGGKRKKNKKKKGGKRKKNKKGQGQDSQPATLVVVQAAPEHHEVDHGHGSDSAIFSHGSSDDDDETVAVKPMKKRKQKRRMKGKRKRKGQHGGSNSVVEHEQSDLSLGLGLLDELVDADDYAGGGGKRKHRNPLNYGRSNGVTRGKKKKKKKAIAKFMLIGSFLKAKIELLLKILGAHLQVKFFAIALIGLLINIARFWIDVKRGSPPSKHHYEDHGDDWSEQGSYWKRSLQTDPSIEDTDSSTDSYQLRQAQQQQPGIQDPHYLAYRNQYQWQ